MIEIDQLDMTSANGCQLNRNISTDGTDADDGDATVVEFLIRSEIPLAQEPIVSEFIHG
jgi:hypothetical protein